MINVTSHILKFRKFLLDSWDDIDALMEDHDWHDDDYFTHEFLQSNWEFLVERQLLKRSGFINSFGIYYGRKRYKQQTVKITHEIICLPKPSIALVDDMSKEIIPSDTRLVFHIFLKKMDVSYGLYPPFNYAGVFARKEKKVIRYMVPVKDVEFFLDEVVNENLPASAS